MKIEEFILWEAFLGVAKHGNFSKAAENLRVPLAQVSKRVAKLESLLKVRLFQRTTRVVTLTDEGKSLLPKITSILEDLREAESLFENKQELSGVVRITSVPFVATRVVLPHLKDFRKKHPNIQLEFDLSERFANLIEEGFDIAIRIETPQHSEMIYRKLAPNHLIFCASKDYLKEHSTPKTPKDLTKHDLLTLNVHRKVKFQDKEIRLGDFTPSKRVTCENGAFLTDLAVAGHGILIRSHWDAKPLIQEGKLVQVLKDYPLEPFGFLYAVVPNKRFLAPRVKVFWDFIIERCNQPVKIEK